MGFVLGFILGMIVLASVVFGVGYFYIQVSKPSYSRHRYTAYKRKEDHDELKSDDALADTDL